MVATDAPQTPIGGAGHPFGVRPAPACELALLVGAVLCEPKSARRCFRTRGSYLRPKRHVWDALVALAPEHSGALMRSRDPCRFGRYRNARQRRDSVRGRGAIDSCGRAHGLETRVAKCGMM